MIPIGTLVALFPYNPEGERPFGIVVETGDILNIVEWLNTDQDDGGYFDESLEIISPIKKKASKRKKAVDR